jgi:hypothetical protein
VASFHVFVKIHGITKVSKGKLQMNQDISHLHAQNSSESFYPLFWCGMPFTREITQTTSTVPRHPVSPAVSQAHLVSVPPLL